MDCIVEVVKLTNFKHSGTMWFCTISDGK